MPDSLRLEQITRDNVRVACGIAVRPDVAWPRLWLNIAAAHQGKGYGRFAVEAFLAEARRRGERRATVSWVPGPGSPEPFYLKLGFRPTGEVHDGETVAMVSLA